MSPLSCYHLPEDLPSCSLEALSSHSDLLLWYWGPLEHCSDVALLIVFYVLCVFCFHVPALFKKHLSTFYPFHIIWYKQATNKRLPLNGGEQKKNFLGVMETFSILTLVVTMGINTCQNSSTVCKIYALQHMQVYIQTHIHSERGSK